MVELDKIRKLVQLMVDHDLTEISLRDGGEEISLKRPGSPVAAAPALPGVGATPAAPPAGPVPAATPPLTVEKPTAAEDDGLVPIRSPMVGTFYSSASPETAPYVELGSRVSANSVVCIVEAMKVFNEIKADIAGTVERILASNQDAVEYGQELFLVRPAT